METGNEWTVQVVTSSNGVPAGPDGGAAGGDAGGTTVIRIDGRLGTATSPDLVAGLAAALREHHRVVADVSDLVLAHTTAVHAFTDALERAGGWPAAKLVLAAPGTTLAALLRSSGVGRRVPVHPDVAGAVASVDGRPALVRAWWHFAVDVRAPGTARGYVRRVCAEWDVATEVCEAAEIVVTELVTNAVEHAHSPSTVEVERRHGRFRIAVRDFDTAPLPDVVTPAPTAPRGRGLAMVAAVSTSWGVHVHADGKSVWAEMAA